MRGPLKQAGTFIREINEAELKEMSQIINTNPSPESKVAQKEDKSFFMRMQRQYSQRQLDLNPKFQKEPQLLYANKPQILRKGCSPSRQSKD